MSETEKLKPTPHQEVLEEAEGENMDRGLTSRLFWLTVNLLRTLGKFLWSHKILAAVMVPFVIYAVIAGRAYLQPIVLEIRIQSFEIGMAIVFLYWIRFWIKKKRLWPIVWSAGSVACVFVVIIVGDFQPQRFLTLLHQYEKLEIVELDKLPITINDRVHPLNSIYTESNQRLSESNFQSTTPDIVRWRDGGDVWTIGIEPKFIESRLFGAVERVIMLPADEVNLEFSSKNQEEVLFDSGEDMLFCKDLHYIARQRFGFWRFLSYEPANMKYVPGPDGEIVQIVAMVKWSGIFRPRPVPGGVLVIKQGKKSFLELVKRTFMGEGEWIPPGEIKNHDWLVGQNIMPYDHSKHIGESFRFQYGWTAPMPGRHKNDIRIPHLAGDVNQQPYTTHFKIGESGKDKLYHFFALEPYQEKLKGVNTLVFIPADTIGPVYVYRVAEKQLNIVGVTTVATRIRDVTKEYNSSDRIIHPAEHRPFIKKVNGKIRLAWLSTMVSRSMENPDEYLSSSAENFLTDGFVGDSLPVKNIPPSKWVEVWEKSLKE